MRIPIEWLREFVDIALTPTELALRLTMIGLEVESMEDVDGDTVFEVNVTPNRPDCLSISGIAREVSAAMNLPLRYPAYGISGDMEDCGMKVEIIDEDLCYRYAGRCINGVKVGESPEWVRRRLERCGLRSVNNIVDITNYVLLEMGHPLHAFDRDKLSGRIIRIGRSVPGGMIVTLDGIKRELPEDTLLIWDSERPVAIAGIMGGIETEVDEGTENIFLESAYFLPQSIRRTSKALGLRTESSYRFERGTDIESLDKALDRAAYLIARLAGGRISMKVDLYIRRFKPPVVRVRHGRVSKVLGVIVSDDEVTGILGRLGMEVQKEAGFLTVVPPSFRTDINREIDIIEEVARFYGYDRIPVTVPKVSMSKEARDKRYTYISTIKRTMTGAGFTEAINYSFMSPSMLETLNIADDDPRRRTLSIRNPLRAEESLLRTTLVPSLIQNLVYNISMGIRDVRLFEVSRVFSDRAGRLPDERHHLGAIYFKEKAPSLWKDATPDFYIVKGALESLMDELRIADCRFERSSEPFLHPGQSCDVFVSDRRTGFLGRLHPDIAERLALRIPSPEIIILEINLDSLMLSIPEAVRYTPIPRYPHIDRDIAIIVDDALPASTIIGYLKTYPSELIEDVRVFDFYKGKNIPEGKKSLAFAIRYRSKNRTLTDSEIEELHGRIINYIIDRTGGILRGA